MRTTTAPLLARWFDLMDGDTPEGVLDLVADDFQISIVFSTGDDATARDFSGGRAALEGYLTQREKGTRVHRLLSVGTAPGPGAGEVEFALGEVIRLGEWEATFLASAQLDAGGRVRRMMMGRSPGLALASGVTDAPGGEG